MRRDVALAAAVAAAIIACRQDSRVVDHGGRSLDVPVPSRGTAATTTKGSDKDVRDFPRRARRDPTEIGVRTGPLGAYLVDASGRSLYTFSDDTKDQTACLTNCATVWPPVIVERLPRVSDAAVDAALVTMIPRPDGSRQLAYAGMALYYSESDLRPADTWGHYAMSFGGHFALVSPAGKPLPAPKQPRV